MRKSLRQDGITPVIRASKQIARNVSGTTTALLLPAQGFQAHCRALPTNSPQAFSKHPSRCRGGQLDACGAPTNLCVWDFLQCPESHAFHLVSRKPYFSRFQVYLTTEYTSLAAGGLASVLDVPRGCISVPGWRCRRTCRQLPLQNTPAIGEFQTRRRRISPLLAIALAARAS